LLPAAHSERLGEPNGILFRTASGQQAQQIPDRRSPSRS